MPIDYPANGSNIDQILWERTQQDSLNRLKFAEENKSNSNYGIRANALLILSTYYRGGWHVIANYAYADQCLTAAADLGHAQACFDLARKLLSDGKIDTALHYIDKGLSKIEDTSFNSPITDHNQPAMKVLLTGLGLIGKKRSENSAKKPSPTFS